MFGHKKQDEWWQSNEQQNADLAQEAAAEITAEPAAEAATEPVADSGEAQQKKGFLSGKGELIADIVENVVDVVMELFD